MLSLQSHHITDLYVLVDDLIVDSPKPLGGRPTVLKDSEIITILIWNTLLVKQKTLKNIYKWVNFYHRKEFPKLPVYSNFIRHCHRVLPQLIYVLQFLLMTDDPIKLVDSTMLEVCKLVRADNHKVAKNTAKFGKNHQGWHYGFKLHATVNLRGQLCSLAFTPADQHDAQQLPKLINSKTKIVVGDGGYTAQVMRKHIWKTFGTFVLSPPHYKQNKKLLTDWQKILLQIRPKIESVFGYLKEHLFLVTSFPRSVAGYLLHYIRILLGYQLMVS
jgi:hypothetical protein